MEKISSAASTVVFIVGLVTQLGTGTRFQIGHKDKDKNKNIECCENNIMFTNFVKLLRRTEDLILRIS